MTGHNNWHGIFVEPVQFLFARLKQNYGESERFVFENKAVGARTGTTPFYYVSEQAESDLGDELPFWHNQLGSFDRNDILKHLNGRLEPYIIEQSIDTITFPDLLHAHNVTDLDLLLIDTEGYDYQVLSQIDFQSCSPRVVVYEHKHLPPEDRSAAESLLISCGYVCHILGKDTVAFLADGRRDADTGETRGLLADRHNAIPSLSPRRQRDTDTLREPAESDVGSTGWAFVCQAGPLESQSCLLAASMLEHVNSRDRAELIALVPGPTSITGEVRSETIACLENLGVRIVRRDNEYLKSCNPIRMIDWFTNKMTCIEIETDAHTVVFLDSDQICHSPVNSESLFAVAFTARKVGYAGAKATEGLWSRIAEVCEFSLPAARFRIHTPPEHGGDIFVPPLFNAGLIAVRRRHVKRLVGHWRDCFQRLKDDDTLGKQRFFVEQVAFAAAVMISGVTYNVENPREIDRSFEHYIRVDRLRGQDHIVSLIRDMLHRNEELDRVVRRDPEWVKLLDCQPDHE